MRVPLKITFRDVRKTREIENLIQTKAAKLDKIHDSIISCRVSVERPHEHQKSGNPFRVRINMRVPPGHELVVTRKSTDGNLHERLPAVILEAFEAVFRRLKKLVEKQQGLVKSHPTHDQIAFVIRLFPDEDYGFIRTQEGRELYFHRNSVLNDAFDRLEIGTGVRFIAEAGEKGPQASTVHIADKPGVRAAKSAERN